MTNETKEWDDEEETIINFTRKPGPAPPKPVEQASAPPPEDPHGLGLRPPLTYKPIPEEERSSRGVVYAEQENSVLQEALQPASALSAPLNSPVVPRTSPGLPPLPPPVPPLPPLPPLPANVKAESASGSLQNFKVDNVPPQQNARAESVPLLPETGRGESLPLSPQKVREENVPSIPLQQNTPPQDSLPGFAPLPVKPKENTPAPPDTPTPIVPPPAPDFSSPIPVVTPPAPVVIPPIPVVNLPAPSVTPLAPVVNSPKAGVAPPLSEIAAPASDTMPLTEEEDPPTVWDVPDALRRELEAMHSQAARPVPTPAVEPVLPPPVMAPVVPQNRQAIQDERPSEKVQESSRGIREERREANKEESGDDSEKTSIYIPQRATDEVEEVAWVVIMKTPSVRLHQFFRLDSARMEIGRSYDTPIFLDDRTVSMRHAAIRYERVKEKDEFVLYDLASTNGTYLNDVSIHLAVLKDNDRIRVGETEMAFKKVEEARREPDSK